MVKKPAHPPATACLQTEIRVPRTNQPQITDQPVPKDTASVPGLLRRRLIVLAGILIMALSLRLAVSGVSPVLAEISNDLPFGPASIGVLGMLPTAAFAVAGFTTPALIRKLGIPAVLLGSLVLAASGQIGRALASDVPLFLGFSALTMVGYGLGNIVMPPLVKRYFPDRIGLVTSLYVTLLAVSTAFSPLVAVPLANTSGWRWSIGIWAGVSMAALVPWIATLLGERATRRAEAVQNRSAAKPHAKVRVWSSPVAWGLAMVFAGTSTNTFSMFTWLPPLLLDAGMDAAQGGTMLSYYAILGLPTSLLVPYLAARMRNPFPLAALFVLCYAGGYAGLLLAPSSGTILWITLAGLGQGTFAMALLLVNLRTRTTAGSGALSGFAQGIGYSVACLGPLTFGLLKDITGTWATSFGLLAVSLVVLVVGAFIVSKPRYLEDHPRA